MDAQTLIFIGKAIGLMIALYLAVILFNAALTALERLGYWLYYKLEEFSRVLTYWMTENLLKLLKSPFQVLAWLISFIYLNIAMLILNTSVCFINIQNSLKKRRDLKAFYKKHREQFDDWHHFKRWVADEKDESTSSSTGKDSYSKALEVLGLQKGFSQKEFKTAYRRISSFVHPDKGCPTDYFAKEVTDAIKIIKAKRNWK